MYEFYIPLIKVRYFVDGKDYDKYVPDYFYTRRATETELKEREIDSKKEACFGQIFYVFLSKEEVDKNESRLYEEDEQKISLVEKSRILNNYNYFNSKDVNRNTVELNA